MEKTGLSIKILGDPVLRKKSRQVRRVSDEHRRTLSTMSRFMHDSNGIGLAAPQIGLNDAMIVVDIGTGLYKLINPRIVEREGEQVLEEGCLSVPGVYIKIKRSRRVVLEALDEEAKPLRIEAQDLLACVFQHEIDHLNGKLIFDYASVIKKLQIKRKMRALAKKKASDEGLPEPKRERREL